MDVEEFQREAPGQLVTIPGGHAFIPNRLPPQIESGWDLVRELDGATRCLARLDGLAALIQNKALVTRPLLTREAMESARLEGTHTHIAGVLRQEAGEGPSDPTEASNNREVLN